MTAPIPFRAALLICAMTAAASASAQSAREPRFKFDGSGTRLIEVSNLPGTEGCAPATSTGRITKRHMENGKFTGVTFKDARYEDHINLPDASEFRSRATGERVREALDGLLVPGAQLRIRSAACGAAGRIVVLSSVTLVGAQAEQPKPAASAERAQATLGTEAAKPAERDDADRVLLQVPGGSREPLAAAQAERSDAGVRAEASPPSLPKRTAWRASAPTKVQFDMAIASTDRAAGWSISCMRNVKGQVHFSNWLVGSRSWRPNAQTPRIAIDGVVVKWEIDGADEGVVLSDSMQDNATALSPNALMQIARGERLVIAGFGPRDRPRDIVFDISGGEAAFASFQARCQTLPRS
ncbi:hypothetical protein [Bosea sp. PAMC 26642]|uniref:hypothetical protein n=1 Tax=Bosea sp. (strain PAMC 26642) TaxID=1792307 RepID=UPI0007703128|nr:hypothetical protein [Bosea sp. PAMC 26642]AMJ59113.1 hypothetical protein AXW83_01275 [Bosea sp. PAMC 26642]